MSFQASVLGSINGCDQLLSNKSTWIDEIYSYITDEHGDAIINMWCFHRARGVLSANIDIQLVQSTNVAGFTNKPTTYSWHVLVEGMNMIPVASGRKRPLTVRANSSGLSWDIPNVGTNLQIIISGLHIQYRIYIYIYIEYIPLSNILDIPIYDT